MRVDNARTRRGFDLALAPVTCQTAVMSKVINLATVRKARARAEAASKAAENRVTHGRTKTERARDTLVHTRLERQLDGVKVDEAGSDPETP